MRRALSGDLAHLGPRAVLRLLAAGEATGVLELTTSSASALVRFHRGRVERPGSATMGALCEILESTAGEFRFDPRPPEEVPGNALDLAALLDACRQAVAGTHHGFSVENIGRTVGHPDPQIHLLGRGTPEDPLEDMLAELEASAPEELLFAQVGIVTADPRPWRGSLEADWKRRGWELSVYGAPDELVLMGRRLGGALVGRR